MFQSEAQHCFFLQICSGLKKILLYTKSSLHELSVWVAYNARLGIQYAPTVFKPAVVNKKENLRAP